MGNIIIRKVCNTVKELGDSFFTGNRRFKMIKYILFEFITDYFRFNSRIFKS